MNVIKQFFHIFIILLLLVLLFTERCQRPSPVKPEIRRDTVWIKHDTVIYAKPKPVKTVPVTKYDTCYVPDKNYPELLKQYNALLMLYLQKNIYSDTLKVQYGYITVNDTVEKNLLQGRAYRMNLSFPVITEHIPLKPKNQLYIGGSLEGNLSSPVDRVNASLLLKNKRDQLYGVYTGINTQGQITYGISTYWKIKLHK